jgi:hypothetical protein
MIRSIFISALLPFTITHIILTAAAHVHYHIPNPNIYHFNHLLQRQDSSLVDSDIPAPATPAAPSSLATTLITAVTAAASPTDTTNLSSGQVSASIPSDGSDTSTITTPTNELIPPLVPITSSIQLSTQHNTSPPFSTSSSSPTPSSNAATSTATTSQLDQSSPSTTTLVIGGSTALSAAQSASFQLGSSPSIGMSVATAAGLGATGLDIEPGSGVMSSAAMRGIVRDGRFWGILIGILGIVWI